MFQIITKSTFWKNNIKIKKLENQHEFVVGINYYRSRSFNFIDPWKIESPEVIVHNNNLATREAKTYRFRESMFWFVNNDGYYDSKTNKYLTYSNKYELKNVSSTNYELISLSNAIAMGYLLDRIVILPAFSCDDHSTDRPACNFLKHFKLMVALERNFSTKYREHIFLNHTLVPSHITNSVSQTISIQECNDKSNRSRNDYQVTSSQVFEFETAKDHFGPTVEDIQSCFCDRREKVLVFDSMYGSFFKFPNKTEYKGIKSLLESTFRV